MFLNIRVSPTAATSEPTANTLFIKTQYKHTRQPGQLQFVTRYTKHEKNLFLNNIKIKTQEKIFDSDYIQNTRNEQQFQQ